MSAPDERVALVQAGEDHLQALLDAVAQHLDRRRRRRVLSGSVIHFSLDVRA